MDITDFAFLTAEQRKKKRADDELKKNFKGYIKLFRDIQKTELWTNGDGTLLKVYLFCLLRANSSKKKTHLEKLRYWLKPNEFATGRFSGSEKCNISDKTFKIKLNELEKLGIIKQKIKQSYRVVTVLNLNTPFTYTIDDEEDDADE